MGDYLAARTTGEALSLLRERAGLTQQELADRSGVAHGTLSRYERDETDKPDATVLRKLVRVLAAACGHDPERLWQEFGELLDAAA